jgi:hypothetical protein
MKIAYAKVDYEYITLNPIQHNPSTWRSQYSGSSSLVKRTLSGSPDRFRELSLRDAKLRPQIWVSTPTVRCTDGSVFVSLPSTATLRVSVGV